MCVNCKQFLWLRDFEKSAYKVAYSMEKCLKASQQLHGDEHSDS